MSYTHIQYTQNETELLQKILEYETVDNSKINKQETQYISVDETKFVGKSGDVANTNREQAKIQEKIRKIKEQTLLIAEKLIIFKKINANDSFFIISEQRLDKLGSGDVIIPKGEKLGRLYFLISGSVNIQESDPHILNKIVNKRYSFINVKSYINREVLTKDVIAGSNNTQIFSFAINETYVVKMPFVYRQFYLNIASYLADALK